jgi:raffinose/stachyose/melibiose transport system substrate-binding protein
MRLDVSCQKLRPGCRRGLVAASLAALLLAAGPQAAARAETLTVWDNYPEAERSPVVQTLIAEFEKANPGVTVQRTARSYDDITLTAKLVLSSGKGPEVMQTNQGPGDMGVLVANGLLRPLDPWFKQYGWDHRVSASSLQRNQWSKAGEFGKGETYGIAPLGELVGLYYNKKLLTDAGLSVPKTYADFGADLAALKAKGTVPLMIGDSDGVGAMQVFAILQQLNVPASDRIVEDDLIYGRRGSFKGPSFLWAATTLLDWQNKGYFFPGYQGISRDDAATLFLQNQAAFMISGSWNAGLLKANPDIGFVEVPPLATVPTPLVEGGTDLAYSITNIAKTPAEMDLAAKYIDFMLSEQAAETWANAGFLPDKPLDHPERVKLNPLLTDIFAAWTQLNRDNALGHYLDWATPTMFNTLSQGLPEVLAGRITPAAFVDRADKDYQAYLAKTVKK